MTDKIPMTLNGKRLIEDELKRLMTVDRPSVVKAIENARGHGDISENADYHAAKERQSFIEGRILDLNGKLAKAEVIDTTKIKSERVVFGATVVLEDQGEGREVTYRIVGVDEADVKKGMVGITSPIARALIGKSEGDEVVVQAPKGPVTYEIISVRYE